MKPLSFRLLGWKSWTLNESAPDVPTLLRRRVTPIGQRAINSAWFLPETANARLVLSSRHGEYSRTLSLLRSVVDKEELSPSDFTLSVHHALAGLLSIVDGNRKGHTAVASGAESFCCGLIEAVTILKESPKEPVVLIHFDELLPDPFVEFNKSYEKSVAFALALGDQEEGAPMVVETVHSRLDETLITSHAENFLDFLRSGAAEKISAGEHQEWRWARHAIS